MTIRFQDNGTSPTSKRLCSEAFQESEEIVKGWGFSKINYIEAQWQNIEEGNYLINRNLSTLNLFTGATMLLNSFSCSHKVPSLFGIKFQEGTYAYRAFPPDKGADITFKYENVAYAHFYYPNIIVFLSRIEISSDFKQILKEFLKAADEDMKNRKEMEPVWLLKRLAEQRKKALTLEVDNAIKEYHRLEGDLVKQKEIFNTKNEELKSLFESKKEKNANDILATWGALKNNKKIKSIVISVSEGVIITTHEYRTRPIAGIRYKLGRFKIVLKFGQFPEITNLSYPNMPHPHMSSAGSFCWGVVHGNVIRAIAEGDILKLANLTLTVLGEVNIGDQWGFNIQNFPRCRALKKDKEAASKTPTATADERDDEDYEDWLDEEAEDEE